MSKSYGQFCPIAAGLDVIGERWVLLILRELSLGDQRFTDLRSALPGIAPNLLSERLRALQDAGLVVSAELPPPAARSVYRMTDEGRKVVPVLQAMARFGAAFLDGAPSERMDARRAAYALLVPWWRPSGPSAWRARIDLAAAGNIDLLADGDRLRVAPADPSVTADVVLSTTVEALGAARRDDAPLEVHITGAPSVVADVLTSFGLEPATNRVARRAPSA